MILIGNQMIYSRSLDNKDSIPAKSHALGVSLTPAG